MLKAVWKVLFTILLFSHAFVLPQKSPDKISFIPHWLPQSQFAGYYAAYELGIYKKYNIDLTILLGGPQNPSPEVFRKKEADFASMWLTNGIHMRAEGYKIINIGQILRKSAFMLVAKKSSGIREPKDMNGKKVGLWDGFKIRPMQFFKKYNLKVVPVTLGGTMNLFLLDGIHVTSAMWYNEYHNIINAGLNEDELVTFFFSDHGMNFPEEGIYVYEDFYKKNPDLCNRFVKASLEGWLWCFNNEDKAVEIVTRYMKAANVGVNKSHQDWMLSVFKDLMLVDNNRIDTKLSEKDFEFVVESLKESGIIEKSVKYEDFHRYLMGGK
jgi:NitT/TauT family transport system substrate-binding protein